AAQIDQGHRSRARRLLWHPPPCFPAKPRAKPGNRFEAPLDQQRHRAISERGCDDLRVCDNGTWARPLLAWFCNALASPHGSWPCPTTVWVLVSSFQLLTVVP